MLDATDHLAVNNKGDWINLVKGHEHLSKMLKHKVVGINTPNWFDKDSNANLAGINCNNILRDDFNNKVNKMLDTLPNQDLLNKEIIIMMH